MSAMGFNQGKITTLGLNVKEVEGKTLGSLPLWRFISLLTAGQLYAIIGATFCVTGGSFVIGYNLRSETADALAAGDTYRIERLTEQHNKDVEEKRVLLTQIEFLKRMARINATTPVKLKKLGKRSTQDPSHGQQPARDLAKFLDNNVGTYKDENGNPDVEVVLGADRNDSKIRFRHDEELFYVPEKVKRLSQNITWVKPRSESTTLEILQSLPNQQMSPQRTSRPLSSPIPLLDPFDGNQTEPPSTIAPLPKSRRLIGRMPNLQINRKEAVSPATTKCILLHSKRPSSFSLLRA